MRVSLESFHRPVKVWPTPAIVVLSLLIIGATVEEIFEVLKFCVSQGVQDCTLGVPILKEKLACRSGQGKA